MNIIVISLNRAQERRKRIKEQLDSLDIDAVIMDAVDGESLSNEDKNKKLHLPGGYRYGELFKPGEIGCTMSHINSLKIARENKWNYVIILEDDVVLAEDFEKRIKILFKFLPNNWEHVYLSGIPKKEPSLASMIFPNIINSGFTECTHSMMINSSAYEKIINKLSKFETTTDDIYCDLVMSNNLNSFTYYPFVTYANDGYTYIWNHELKREHKSKKYFKNKI